MQDHQDTMARITDNLIQDQRNELAAVSRDLLNVFKSDTRAVITTLEAEVTTKTQTVCQQLDTMSASSIAASEEQLSAKSLSLINDLNTAATEIIAKIQVTTGDKSPEVQNTQAQGCKGSDTTDSTLQQPKAPTATQASNYVNPLFPNVDPKTIREFTPRNPYLDNQLIEGNNTTVPASTLRDPMASPQRPSSYTATTAGISDSRVNQTNGSYYQTGQQTFARARNLRTPFNFAYH